MRTPLAKREGTGAHPDGADDGEGGREREGGGVPDAKVTMIPARALREREN